MSGYPGGGYPGGGPAGGGYPGAPQGGGYPGAPQQPGGGYPGAPGGGYPGAPQGAPQGYGAPPGGPAGYRPPGPAGGPAGYGAPPGVDPNIASWFRAVDSDNSGQISAEELKRALVNGNWSHFSEEACRMMIDMYDANNSGSIDLNEFNALFDCINKWKGVFESYDQDRSGRIEEAELTRAFQQMGYRFSPTFVQNILAKYDSKTRRMTLDNFIVCCVQIKRLTDSFRVRDREMKGAATLQYEDFIGLAMGAHK